jgi:ribonucleoside-diphosphate reductase alpha chain
VAAAGSAAATGDTSAGYGAFALDESKLKETVRKAVHFLDNVIDVNRYPLDEIAERSRGSRKIGLGVMGWADMLLRLSIPYDSREAALLAERVMHLIQSEAREASIGLAKARGVFPYHEKSIYKELDIALRNATTTTIAPTGTLSILAGASSGIEPLFAISYIRNIMDGQEFVEVNPIFLEIAQTRGFYSEELMRRIAREGSVAHIPEVPEDVRRVFVTAHDIAPEWHVRMQASFQKYTDNAVSKTVNLASDASAEDVRDVFLLAYKTLCKGVTIYRDKSRDAQVLNIGGDGDGDAAKSTAGAPLAVTTPNQRPAVTTPRQRPAVTTGFTEKVLIGCGKLYITVNYDANGICEVFTSTGKAGGCPSQSEATARLVSVALRSGVDPREIIAQLKGIRCPSTIRQPGMKVLSCPDAIARMLEKVLSTQFANAADGTGGAGGGLADGGARVLAALRPLGADGGLEGRPAGGEWGVSAAAPDYAELPSVCPECGSALEHEGGCVICRECGFSKCG